MEEKIRNRNLEQLKKYVALERQLRPEDAQKTHILEWAIAEILSLRERVNQLENPPW